MSSNLLKSVAFGLAALALPASAQLQNASLRDIRIYISFEPGSGYDISDAQDEFYRAARLGMQMFEGVVPAMRVKFVSDQASANIVFSVGNHGYTIVPDCADPATNPTGRGYHSSENPTGWIGCSLNPNNLGYINRDDNEAYNDATIYFNTKGVANFLFDDFTYESRQTMWNSYEPAALPPLRYNDGSGINGNLGWINGRFTRQVSNNLDLEDAVGIIMHEFGHCFGAGHALETLSTAQMFGCTGSGCTSPTLVGPVEDGNNIITWQYYGCPSPLPDCPANLKFGSYKAHYMVSYKATGLIGPTPLELLYDGIPIPPLNKFNFRVLRQDFVDFLWRQDYSNSHSYPKSRGIIQLRTDSTGGATAMVSDWTQALGLAQLSNSHTTQSNPFLVTGIHNQGQLQKVAAGTNHALAIHSEGTLWAWGANDKGQLGNGTTTPSANPVPILPTVNTWVAVAAGDGFSLALRSDNSLWVWGSRSNGQLGDGVVSSTAPVTTPKQIGGNEWAAVKAGALHAVALRTDGTLRTWGYNGFGQLGVGDISDRSTPTEMAIGFRHTDWVGLAAGSVNTAGQRADGSLWTWGWNDYGNVGDGSYTLATEPKREAWWMDRWQFPALGHDYSMNLDREGRLWTWGGNFFGQLGASPTDFAYLPMDRLGDGWVSVSAGQWSAGGIKKDGSLWNWGNNESGRLGGGAAVGASSATPVREATQATDWSDLYNGANFGLAMKYDGSLWAWGSNASGQFGTGSTGGTAHTPQRSKWSAYVPRVELSIPSRGYKYGVSIPLQATLTFGIAQRVEFWRSSGSGDVKIGEDLTVAPGGIYSLNWTNAPIGEFAVWAVVYDYLGKSSTSPVGGVTVERLSIAVASPIPSSSTTVNLSNQGTVYWQHSGLAPEGDPTNTTTFKADAVRLYSEPMALNNAAISSVTSPSHVPFTWSGGWPLNAPPTSPTKYSLSITPTVVGTNGHGLSLESINGLPQPREYILNLYVYATGVSTRLTVSTPNNTWTHNWSGAAGRRLYTITFTASGQPTIKWQATALGSGTRVMRIQALTLR